MGRARVVSPPPKDYIPEPLVASPVEVEVEQVIANDWTESNLTELIEETEQEEQIAEDEKDRIAKERHEEILRQRTAAEEEARLAAEAIAKAKEIIENPPVKVEQIYVPDPKVVEELEALKKENQKLVREKEALERAREETILAARRKVTQQKESQLNLIKQRKPSLWSRIKQFLRERRVKLATVGIKNYETAILERARIAVPRMLDEIEKMHEQLTIMEELLAKYVEAKNNQPK